MHPTMRQREGQQPGTSHGHGAVWAVGRPGPQAGCGKGGEGVWRQEGGGRGEQGRWWWASGLMLSGRLWVAHWGSGTLSALDQGGQAPRWTTLT